MPPHLGLVRRQFEEGGVTSASRGIDMREMAFPWNGVSSGRDALAFTSEGVYVAVVRPKSGDRSGPRGRVEA